MLRLIIIILLSVIEIFMSKSVSPWVYSTAGIIVIIILLANMQNLQVSMLFCYARNCSKNTHNYYYILHCYGERCRLLHKTAWLTLKIRHLTFTLRVCETEIETLVAWLVTQEAPVFRRRPETVKLFLFLMML